MEKLEWSALEYEEQEKSKDWFWALGIIVITSSLASLIYSNYFFAILIILSGILLGFFATKKPDLVRYELNKKGLKIRNSLYPYENMQSFWVQVEHPIEEREEHILFIKSERPFMPILTIPIEDHLAEDIHVILTANGVPEEEMREHPAEKILESLGF